MERKKYENASLKNLKLCRYLPLFPGRPIGPGKPGSPCVPLAPSCPLLPISPFGPKSKIIHTYASLHKILHKIGFTRTGFRQLQHVVVSKKTVYKCYFIHFASQYVRKFARSYQTFDFRSTSFRLLHHNVKQRLPISVYVQHQLPCNPGIPRNPMSPLIPASPLTPV